MKASSRHIYLCRTANMSWRTCVVVKQIQSNQSNIFIRFVSFGLGFLICNGYIYHFFSSPVYYVTILKFVIRIWHINVKWVTTPLLMTLIPLVALPWHHISVLAFQITENSNVCSKAKLTTKSKLFISGLLSEEYTGKHFIYDDVIIDVHFRCHWKRSYM